MPGLPWTNPLKLTIGSDEHILDTTINRGLMMLLNNDYYLDMKTTLMSQELSAVIDNTTYLNNVLTEHISNASIHNGRGTTIINNTYTTVVSGGQSATEIQVDLRNVGERHCCLFVNYGLS